MQRTVITGTGSYIPADIKKNSDFESGTFYTEKGRVIDQLPEEIIEKFRQITGIEERRYAPANITTSGMAVAAAINAIAGSNVDMEQIDQIIVAHNYGDMLPDTFQPDTVPSLASRVKHALGIKNPSCIAYDILFGCPGWLQAVIQADISFRAGAAGKCLVIGTEMLSRIIDRFDRDSMIFSDGAGACIVEYLETGDSNRGILSSAVRSDCSTEVGYIHFDASYAPDATPGTRYIKMKGRKVYEYALSKVPVAMKECLDKSGVDISELKKIFIHQANEKMDDAIIKAFYALYNISTPPEDIMPMSIHWLGNSSVATIPTLYDMVQRGLLPQHQLSPGDVILFASVGAGMNINAVCYRY